jgi:membrane protein DedA with SNARE-associated domain
MFTEFSHLVADASGWAYLIVLAFAVVDALLPIVPSEAAVLTAGVVASNGDLLLPVEVCQGFWTLPRLLIMQRLLRS